MLIDEGLTVSAQQMLALAKVFSCGYKCHSGNIVTFKITCHSGKLRLNYYAIYIDKV